MNIGICIIRHPETAIKFQQYPKMFQSQIPVQYWTRLLKFAFKDAYHLLVEQYPVAFDLLVLWTMEEGRVAIQASYSGASSEQVTLEVLNSFA